MKKIVDIDVLSRYNENIQVVIDSKIQNLIDAGMIGVKPLVTFDASSISMDPNKYYRLTSAQTSLNIILNTPVDDTILNEYFIEFTCNTSMTLTISPTVKWANATIPTFESGKTYQISIVNNLAVCASFG